MRLIDADALKKDVEDFPNCYNGWSDAYDKAFIIGAIEEHPSIDIVFCKECKYSRNGDEFMWCDHEHGMDMVKPDDFCSYGQRKESE